MIQNPISWFRGMSRTEKLGKIVIIGIIKIIVNAMFGLLGQVEEYDCGNGRKELYPFGLLEGEKDIFFLIY